MLAPQPDGGRTHEVACVILPRRPWREQPLVQRTRAGRCRALAERAPAAPPRAGSILLISVMPSQNAHRAAGANPRRPANGDGHRSRPLRCRRPCPPGRQPPRGVRDHPGSGTLDGPRPTAGRRHPPTPAAGRTPTSIERVDPAHRLSTPESKLGSIPAPASRSIEEPELDLKSSCLPGRPQDCFLRGPR